MAENNECTHDCSTCGADCSSRKSGIPKEQLNPMSSVKKVIGVVSGKGGVGKSIVTSMMAVEMSRRDYTVGILDADITGPSIPKAFNAKGGVVSLGENLMTPHTTISGIQIMSVNLLLDEETKPVVWRGPVIAGAVKQFWTDVVWNDVDYMFVDMPPGTGDVPLTVFQSLPVDGIIIVTTPQDLVTMVVEKAVNMAKLMNVRILGLVENMSYAVCPDCGKAINIFGESKAEATGKQYGIPVLAKIPIDPRLTALVDKGSIEIMDNNYLSAAADAVEGL